MVPTSKKVASKPSRKSPRFPTAGLEPQGESAVVGGASSQREGGEGLESEGEGSVREEERRMGSIQEGFEDQISGSTPRKLVRIGRNVLRSPSEGGSDEEFYEMEARSKRDIFEESSADGSENSRLSYFLRGEDTGIREDSEVLGLLRRESEDTPKESVEGEVGLITGDPRVHPRMIPAVMQQVEDKPESSTLLARAKEKSKEDGNMISEPEISMDFLERKASILDTISEEELTEIIKLIRTKEENQHSLSKEAGKGDEAPIESQLVQGQQSISGNLRKKKRDTPDLPGGYLERRLNSVPPDGNDGSSGSSSDSDSEVEMNRKNIQDTTPFHSRENRGISKDNDIKSCVQKLKPPELFIYDGTPDYDRFEHWCFVLTALE
ncbi:hypothetical protein M422DRAFT_273199 [Sphaerobolus stellatus SS14]|uniref:Uncharacterized protein n=1 Tax=Sphaerobolus stellatus (strain SS14) TaxID=990650 RepID=A0A0C9UKL2_SPHS4|nr:hypothetical protein M422DRAFT_273199 [Sphaerobolus stellatus SS14]